MKPYQQQREQGERAVVSAADLKVKDRVVVAILDRVTGGNDTDIGALFIKGVFGAVITAVFYPWFLIEDRQRVEVFNRLDVRPRSETTELVDVFDNPQINKHLGQQIVQILHDKHRARHLGNIFAVLFGLTLLGLEHGKVRLEEIDTYETNVVFKRNATVTE